MAFQCLSQFQRIRTIKKDRTKSVDDIAVKHETVKTVHGVAANHEKEGSFAKEDDY